MGRMGGMGGEGGGRWRAYLDSTTRRQPPKSEFRRPKPERRPNTEGRSHARAFRGSGFFRPSDFGLRVWAFAPTGWWYCPVTPGDGLQIIYNFSLPRQAGLWYW